MNAPSTAQALSRQDMEAILTATRALAEPFDLMTMQSSLITRKRNGPRAKSSTASMPKCRRC
jgi:hypothetical protein